MYNACITISSLVPDLQVSGNSVGEGETHGTHKIEKHTHTVRVIHNQIYINLPLGMNVIGWELSDTLVLYYYTIKE